MARDVSIRLDRCHYCNRPGFVVWDVDLFTCGREVCKTLAFAEVRRRHRDGVHEAPERELARALLTAFDTFDYAVRRDESEELFDETEANRLRNHEREQTARMLSELRELARRYPPLRAVETASEPVRAPDPRHRRFVRRGRTVPLRVAA